MNRSKTWILALLMAGFLAPLQAASQTAPQAGPPEEIAFAVHATEPYGSGKYAILFITAFDAQLWTDAPAWSMDAPFAMTLRYHISFSADYLISRSLREMRHVDPALTDADIARYRKAMTPIFAPASSGDEMSMLYLPGQPGKPESVWFFKNGSPTGKISEPGFARDFFGVWLSPATSDPDLRKALLRLK